MFRMRHLDRDVIMRVAADIVLVNLALAVALAARVLTFVWLDEDQGRTTFGTTQQILHDSAYVYWSVAPILTLLCLGMFAAFGFYTFGRAYRSRWKALIIVQAVTLSFLTLGALDYFLTKVEVWMPRSVWVAAWLLTLLFVAGARFSSRLWMLVARVDRKLVGNVRKRKIHNVLVIGGAGYIGSILVRKLLDRGYNVSVLDALVYGDESIRELYGRNNFELIKNDFRNIEGVVQALQFADAVIHLGAVVGDPACALDERLTLEVNLAATRMIAEAARGFGIERFIFASTCSVYGASDQTSDERSTLNPISLYAQSKIDAEQVLLALNDEGFSPTILRFATIYGLSPRPRFDLVVNVLAARGTVDKRITIFGGDQWRPFIHVDDVATALLRTLEAPLAVVKGQVFNVGSDSQNYRIKDVGALVKDIMPDVEVIQQGEDVDKRNYRVSFAKIRKQLDFQPAHTVPDGIREIHEAIVAGKIDDYRQARYSNYDSLTESGIRLLTRRPVLSTLYSGGLEAPLAEESAVRLAGAS
jgi:nucleoside-diphosphate-sugar epimerase